MCFSPSPRTRANQRYRSLHHRQGHRAFSITELLVVVGIIVFIAAISVPAYQTITQGRKLGDSAKELTSFLELARSEAVARQTYVWVGVESQTVDGNTGIAVGAVYSRDGTGTNTAPANLAPLLKVLNFKGAKLLKFSDLREETKAKYPNHAPQSVADSTQGAVFTEGNVNFNRHTITFTPRGEALLKGAAGPDDGYIEAIDISLRRANGTTARNDADELAIIVEGATGTVKVVRM